MAVNTLRKPKKKRTLKSYFPIMEWLPKYQGAWFRPDLIAALTVWALLVPEAMAYAGIAGMPPQAGLYAAPLALLGYAVFGTSRHLNVGPSSTVAALSFSVVASLGLGVATDEWILATVTLALLSGVVLVVSGLLKLGVLADFLSRPVLDGFIVGLAITIAVGQLDKILGYEAREVAAAFGDFVPEILLLLSDLDMIQGATFVVGVVSLALLFLIERFIPRVPGALTVLVLAIAASYLLGLEQYGVHIVGEIPAGLPPFGLPGTSRDLIVRLIPGALAIALVGFAESVAAARSYATKFGYSINADQEMIALGAANMGAGLSQGFAVDGSLSKTAASVEAGATSQMVSIIAAAAVLITAAFLTPLFYYLPEATLGAIVIHAVWRLINYRKISRYWTIDRLDFWSGLTAALGVLMFGILPGLLLAVGVSLLGLLVGTKDRTTFILGKAPEQNTYQSLEYYPDGETFPGILVLRFDGSLFFANAPNFVDEVRYGVQITEPTPQVVLLDFESTSSVDATAVELLNELFDELHAHGLELRLARVKTRVREVMRADGLERRVGREHFYLSVHQGVDAFLAEQEAELNAA